VRSPQICNSAASLSCLRVGTVLAIAALMASPTQRTHEPSFAPPPIDVSGVHLRPRPFGSEADLIAKLASRRSWSHYQVLGVTRNATSAQVEAAFVDQADRWQPRKLGEYLSDDDASHAVERWFMRLWEARRVLLDAELRARYDEQLDAGGADRSEAGELERSLEAAAAFQRAELLLARGKLEEAEHAAKLAVDGDPLHGDYLALHAWIRLQLPNPDPHEIRADLILALRLAPDSVRVRWYRGLALKALGKHVSALHEFRAIVDRHPEHLDAQREVHVYEMRLRQSPEGQPSLAPRAIRRPKSWLSWLWPGN
jgi:tetratricopeptide (TPR) repeat protein